MSNPYEAPQTYAPELGHRKPTSVGKYVFRGFLVVAAIVIIVSLFFLPADRSVPQAARRIQCTNNLKQLALALHNYNDIYGTFPPAYTVDANGKPLHSWRTLMLPFIEEQQLYSQIDLNKQWDDPVNQEAFQKVPSVFRCPSAQSMKAGNTTYLAVVTPGGFFDPTKSRLYSDVTGDPGFTLMIIEVDAARSVPWMSPQDADEALILKCLQSHSFPHAGGVNAAFVDGSIRFLSRETDANALRAMISIASDDATTVPAEN